MVGDLEGFLPNELLELLAIGGKFLLDDVDSVACFGGAERFSGVLLQGEDEFLFPVAEKVLVPGRDENGFDCAANVVGTGADVGLGEHLVIANFVDFVVDVIEAVGGVVFQDGVGTFPDQMEGCAVSHVGAHTLGQMKDFDDLKDRLGVHFLEFDLEGRDFELSTLDDVVL